MPELPEVETVRTSIEPRILGAKVKAVDLRRRDVVRCASGHLSTCDLLEGDTIVSTMRRGKQLALIGTSGKVVVVQLGMSGQLFCESTAKEVMHTHVHCVWKTLRANGVAERIIFRDPRRFGGLTCLESVKKLEQRWNELGPDALTIQLKSLTDALRGLSRPIKAALLDQSLIAGIGNIYSDEICFMCGVRPSRRAGMLSAAELRQIAVMTRRVLAAAIRARGSTLRDYRDGDGNVGGNQLLLKVYGRGGQQCVQCKGILTSKVIAQRTTVWCRACQR